MRYISYLLSIVLFSCSVTHAVAQQQSVRDIAVALHGTIMAHGVSLLKEQKSAIIHGLPNATVTVIAKPNRGDQKQSLQLMISLFNPDALNTIVMYDEGPNGVADITRSAVEVPFSEGELKKHYGEMLQCVNALLQKGQINACPPENAFWNLLRREIPPER